MSNSKPIFFGVGKIGKKIDQSASFLCNFYESPFTFNGFVYKTVEHYFQSEKTQDAKAKHSIINAKTPKKAKQLGNTCKLDVENWRKINESVMLKGLELKFSQNSDLKDKLIATGSNELREYSRSDKFWGGSLKNSQNKLGKLLMTLREKYLEKES
ncbi:hypothetical protein SteCoe_29740 [Stentor coeruleus]|uniref:NADAR domain-containing protein n=1 Tax=Stentor coeruleus TaxID=5963 RepID=A0A1R2B5A3_9CILI|nr:hypothetical protein SteCoe_29740 [Stentor coeruleus]